MNAEQHVPRSLRLALATWSRRDRRATGEVVVATAQDLIDGGAGAGREALGIVRTGAVLRARGLGRDLIAAPWAQASRLLVVACALLAAGLISAARGGPEGLLSDVLFLVGLKARGDGIMVQAPTAADGAALLLLLSLIVVGVAAATRRRGLALAVTVIAGAMLWVMRSRGYAPRRASFDYYLSTSPGADGRGPGWLGTGIDTDGAIGLLIGCCALTLAIGILRSLATLAAERSRVRRADPTSPTSGAAHRDPVLEPSLAASGGRGAGRFMAVTVAIVLLLPFVAAFPDAVLQRAAIVPAGFSADPSQGGIAATPIWMILVSALLALGVAIGARRASPAVAHAAALVVLAMWIPVMWLGTGLLMSFTGEVPLADRFGETAASLLFWAYTGLFGLALTLWLVASAGRCVRDASAEGSSGPPILAA